MNGQMQARKERAKYRKNGNFLAGEEGGLTLQTSQLLKGGK